MEASIIVPFELQYSDLLTLSNPPSSSSLSLLEIARLNSISDSIMQTLGPNGPGLLSIVGVPKSEKLRLSLLPLARKLALLDSKDRARILKEHGLGSDVPLKDPDRTVSSFALQLKYAQDPSLEMLSSDPGNIDETSNTESVVHRLHEVPDNKFKHLGIAFNDLGHCMMEVGLQLARVCDKAIGGSELEQSIRDSCTAKGRLIHYHSMADNLILRESMRSKGTRNKVGTKTSRNEINLESGGRVSLDEQQKLEKHYTVSSNLWQQWHYDYGIFTVLTAPLFLSSVELENNNCASSCQPCSSPDGHTYLQLLDSTQNKILVVKTSPESFIVQVGEAADILSSGRLHSTLHSVARPVEIECLSRETFVVFLQPAWGKTLPYTGQLQIPRTSPGKFASVSRMSSSQSHPLIQAILKEIPPLSSRLRDGMTFAEFSRETTKQYFGGSGTQSRNK